MSKAVKEAINAAIRVLQTDPAYVPASARNEAIQGLRLILNAPKTHKTGCPKLSAWDHGEHQGGRCSC